MYYNRYARKLLRGLAAWSQSIGFAPHRDFAAVEPIFGDVNADASDADVSVRPRRQACLYARPERYRCLDAAADRATAEVSRRSQFETAA
jgi:hypothetical protein